ncbi:hypothetical protein F5Y16DRAFT_388663 [Xylariaceae sp. FL0255]|nr:hypothetical protein F5Y16DRAFT_388663 [Xylariaceae sp. FL0255]
MYKMAAVVKVTEYSFRVPSPLTTLDSQPQVFNRSTSSQETFGTQAIMPRDGSGRADNAPEVSPETDHDIIHGVGNEPKDDHVARADKTAPMPEHEDGKALKDLPASGGSNTGYGGRKDLSRDTK